MTAGQVQQMLRLRRQAKGARHLRGGEARELEHRRDVTPPARVVGVEAMYLESAARADHLFQMRPPLPLVVVEFEERADVGRRGGIEPAACAASNGVSVAVPPHVAERRQAFQDVLRSGRIEAPALRDRVCRGRSG